MSDDKPYPQYDGADAARLEAEMRSRSEAFAEAWQRKRDEHAARMLVYLRQYGDKP